MEGLPDSIPSWETLATWRDNFYRNSREAFTTMKPQGYIRLVVILGAYALLRPYIMKIGAKLQERQHERDALEELLPADIHPNELRTGKKFAIPGVEESDTEEDEEAKPGQWGKTARVRQRKFIRNKLEEEERRLLAEQEEEEDKDIAHLLED